MREINIDPYENTPRDAVVTANDYPDGQHFALHTHQRGQFAYAACGVISVFSGQGNWVVPPQRAIWVPAGVAHEMTMAGPVTMLNTYIANPAAGQLALPAHCQVFGVSPLLRQLLLQAQDIPALYDETQREGLLMRLLLHEIAAMPPLSLNAPLPNEPRLARACRHLLAQPSLNIGIDDMTRQVGMSRRTFTRRFQRATGLSVGEWLLAERLRRSQELLETSSHSMDRIAELVGLKTAAILRQHFRTRFGVSPSEWRRTFGGLR